MRSLDDALCVLVDHGEVIAQGVVFGSTAALPLHALDGNALARRPWLRLWRPGEGPTHLTVHAEILAADCVLCEIHGPAASKRASRLLEEPMPRGRAVDVMYLVPQGSRLVVARRSMFVRDLVQVNRHDFASASGVQVRVEEVCVTFLSMPVPRGLSGAPVCDAETGAIIGFIHGNAEVNGGAAVCLSHRPLRDWLASS